MGCKKNLILKKLRKIVRSHINEIYEFQDEMASQISMNKAVYELPRKGMDDSINNFNQVNAQKKEKETERDREEENDKLFNSPTLNSYTAPTLTNIYEDATVNLDAQVSQDNLDREIQQNPFPNSDDDKQKVIDFFNSNIDIILNKIKYPGNTDNMTPPNNKF